MKYWVKRSERTGRWQVWRTGGTKPYRTFDTEDEAEKEASWFNRWTPENWETTFDEIERKARKK